MMDAGRSVRWHDREALTLRGLGRAYGLDRHFLGSLVRRGELPALRRGRALLVLRTDFEAWWHRRAATPDKLAEQVVATRLEREARSSTS